MLARTCVCMSILWINGVCSLCCHHHTPIPCVHILRVCFYSHTENYFNWTVICRLSAITKTTRLSLIVRDYTKSFWTICQCCVFVLFFCLGFQNPETATTINKSKLGITQPQLTVRNWANWFVVCACACLCVRARLRVPILLRIFTMKISEWIFHMCRTTEKQNTATITHYLNTQTVVITLNIFKSKCVKYVGLTLSPCTFCWYNILEYSFSLALSVCAKMIVRWK